MNENTRFWIGLAISIIAPILVLGLTGLYGFGKLTARLDNLEDTAEEIKTEIKEVKVDLSQRMDRMDGRMDRIEKNLNQLNQNFIDHLKHHNANP